MTKIETEIFTSLLVSEYVNSKFTGLNVVDAWGEKSFFYNPDNLLKRGIYFCTIKENNGDNDKASFLDRPDVFRVNFGVSKKTFSSIFGTVPKRPTKGNCIDGAYDFTALDSLTPHPVYGWMAWVSILNPSFHSWSHIEILLEESYQQCKEKYSLKKLK